MYKNTNAEPSSFLRSVWQRVEMALAALGLLSIYASMARSAWDWLAGLAG